MEVLKEHSKKKWVGSKIAFMLSSFSIFFTKKFDFNQVEECHYINETERKIWNKDYLLYTKFDSTYSQKS